MQLPEQLRKQVDQVNQHYNELQNPASAEPAEPAQQQPAEPATTEPATPPEPETSGVRPAEPEPSQAPQPQQDLAYWQNRFGILQGKYNAEVPALNAKVKELEAALVEARKAPAPAAAPTAQEAINTIKQLTDEQAPYRVPAIPPVLSGSRRACTLRPLQHALLRGAERVRPGLCRREAPAGAGAYR